MIEALENIWNGLKWFFGVAKGIVTSLWGVVTWVISALAAIWVTMFDIGAGLVQRCALIWDALSSSRTSLSSLTASGVPSAVAQGVAYAGNFVPLNWMLGQTMILAGLFVGAALVRMVKAWIPTVS